jgi:hypothetical protein
MNCNAPEHQTTYRILLIAYASALAVAITVALPQSAHTDNVTPPPVPSNIQVPAGSKAFLVGHAVGTQDYICLPCPIHVPQQLRLRLDTLHAASHLI